MEKDGKKDGKRDGKKNGKKDGVYKSFYGNGNLMQNGSYKNGIPNGLWIFYEKNGRKVRNRKIY